MNTQLDAFHEFTEEILQPSREDYQPFNVMKLINAYTNCNTPLSESWYSFNMITVCGSCLTEDAWVVRPEDCPAGYTLFSGSNTGKVCFCRLFLIEAFEDDSLATDNAVLYRYSTTCTDDGTSLRNLLTTLLQRFTLHVKDVILIQLDPKDS